MIADEDEKTIQQTGKDIERCLSYTPDEWWWELLKKMPTLDPTWLPAVQDRWWAVFWKLLRG